MDKNPEQVFYKISELSEMLGVESSVLRFWEKEFSQIKPLKVGPRKRLYRHKDFETFQEIKRLLYEERFTIAGAKKRLSRLDSRQGRLFDDDDLIGAPPLFEDEAAASEQLRRARSLLDEMRKELLQIKDMLSGNKPAKTRRKAAAKPGKKTAGKTAPKVKDQDLLSDRQKQ